MTKTEQALFFLAPRARVAGEVGAHLWPDRETSIRSCNGGGDYAAQMFLGRLRSRGLVRDSGGEGTTLWELTPAGRAAFRSGR